jgi:hypothetical protein
MSTNNSDNPPGAAVYYSTPVQASPPGYDPEFLDSRGVEARFGLKRSLLYALLTDGSIRGVSLRRRGQMKGKRLFDVASIRDFLRTQIQTGR